jgi:hypothetical protein
MMNELHGPDGRADGNREPIRQESNGSHLSDREVPLNPRRTPAVVQAWLDGEVSMADAIRADAGKDVEFWNRLNEQAEERRHMRTPVHVQQRIMEAIPRSSPASESSWLQRQTHVSNVMLIGLGAAMLGLGVVAALLIAR